VGEVKDREEASNERERAPSLSFMPSENTGLGDGRCHVPISIVSIEIMTFAHLVLSMTKFVQ